MTLHKIKDFYPDYNEQFGDHDLLSFSLYAGQNRDKVGSVDNLLVDDEGRFRYLVVNTGAWIFGKKVLMPIGQAQFDYNEKRVYATRLTREQVEDLPEYNPDQVLNYDYEEQVRGSYRSGVAGNASGSAGLGSTAMSNRPLETGQSLEQDVDVAAIANQRSYTQNDYRYDYDPDLYELGEQNETLKLYEERLVAGKTRQKSGDVTVGKRTETEKQRVSVPVEKERVVVEHVTPTDSAVASGTTPFQEGEVMRVEVYEETPDIRKETFVREEVRVRKETETSSVESDGTIRKERLDVDRSGDTNVLDR
ncbi:MAG: DUF2382 domain-containing protein [Pegethrix bostrychoides GSE-TBD4-15B]|jgi:uncharacterized protein (TIGR02271 family)|uniref:DUF2382 domain-containing protein n=1 Tax=Pegethrix bostrychoides GSE-TBD4-15B TaxID=2839662 RepID=A0A951P9R2_9CYAN|nr:DUF2382 domain-containing protein [Pegethrix bostrychoides GSE-TBD4-15B]